MLFYHSSAFSSVDRLFVNNTAHVSLDLVFFDFVPFYAYHLLRRIIIRVAKDEISLMSSNLPLPSPRCIYSYANDRNLTAPHIVTATSIPRVSTCPGLVPHLSFRKVSTLEPQAW
jgi:hypothetical protein